MAETYFTESQAARRCGLSLRRFRRAVLELTNSGALPIRTLRDQDCPGCGWPEIVDVRDSRGRVLRSACVKDCGWAVEGGAQ